MLRQPFPESALLQFSVDVASAFGFDWTRGRQDKSTHPFATAIGCDDVRITTRFMERYPFSLLFGTLHETGHALYEQGVGRAHHRTQLEGGASLGVHESQSRLWENLVGRSRPFWEHFYPLLQARLPEPLRGVSLDQFYRAINKVEPSLIRVEADEATYNLHVMLRVELEIALVEGRLDAAELPAAWNRLMEEYLGVRPPDDATGVLQDIHWSAGLLGYFATYTLGNLISAQLWERIRAPHPARDADIAAATSRAAVVAAERSAPARPHVRAAGTGAARHRLTHRSGAVPALSRDEGQKDPRDHVGPRDQASGSGPGADV